VGIQRHLVDERADQRGVVQRMPTGRLARRRHPRQQRRRDGFMHDQPAQRGAALARGAGRREDDGAQRQLQIGAG
jgi:hypothetical protein